MIRTVTSRARWLWHNNVSKLDKTLRQFLLMCRIVVPETPGFEEVLGRIDYRIRDATPILDWFHISMKIRHVEQIARV